MRLTVLGMMSGTSHDAIDAALATLSLQGDTVSPAPHGLHSAPIPDALRERIAALLPPAATTIEEVCRLDAELGRLFGEVAREAITALGPPRADLVVSHGQTVFHLVADGRARGTLQLAAPAWIARATRTAVVSDLRSADIVRGGQGAPLASTLDALLLLGPGAPRRGALNLGGIANITLRARDGEVIAYDLGPANALIDAAVAQLTSGRARMDADGMLAARGRVDEAALTRLLDDPYYARPAPKSTGKELFHPAYVAERLGASAPCAGEDLVATLTELTARIVATACDEHGLDELVVSGGGVRNPVLMARLDAVTGAVRVRPLEDFGLSGPAKEAYLFALLGYLSVHGLPGTLPSATGADAPAILGALTPGDGPLRLPAPHRTAIRRLRID